MALNPCLFPGATTPFEIEQMATPSLETTAEKGSIGLAKDVVSEGCNGGSIFSEWLAGLQSPVPVVRPRPDGTVPEEVCHQLSHDPRTGTYRWRRMARPRGSILDASAKRPPEFRDCPHCHRTVDVLTKFRPYTIRERCPLCRERLLSPPRCYCVGWVMAIREVAGANEDGEDVRGPARMIEPLLPLHPSSPSPSPGHRLCS